MAVIHARMRGGKARLRLLLLLACVLIVVGLAVVSILGVGRSRESVTQERLLTLHVILTNCVDRKVDLPADMGALVRLVRAGPRIEGWEMETWRLRRSIELRDGHETLVDGFGRPVIYRTTKARPRVLPGSEYDLYSAGANGLDENGLGDDLFDAPWIKQAAVEWWTPRSNWPAREPEGEDK